MAKEENKKTPVEERLANDDWPKRTPDTYSALGLPNPMNMTKEDLEDGRE